MTERHIWSPIEVFAGPATVGGTWTYRATDTSETPANPIKQEEPDMDTTTTTTTPTPEPAPEPPPTETTTTTTTTTPAPEPDDAP